MSKLRQFALQFDRDYGLEKRTGWSVVVNGSFCFTFEKHLIIAVLKGLYCILRCDHIWDYDKEEEKVLMTATIEELTEEMERVQALLTGMKREEGELKIAIRTAEAKIKQLQLAVITIENKENRV